MYSSSCFGLLAICMILETAQPRPSRRRGARFGGPSVNCMPKWNVRITYLPKYLGRDKHEALFGDSDNAYVSKRSRYLHLGTYANWESWKMGRCRRVGFPPRLNFMRKPRPSVLRPKMQTVTGFRWRIHDLRTVDNLFL
ncbi:hypothetical protein F5Y18DRAFT_310912 [Xylariaceae sp. FL1019]|nr:hypothetical protein F5Y18DRAFT_310912 [Xylariaceae sp. FL1019]